MPKTLSILTPVLASPQTAELLPETITSIERQPLPENWTMEWIVMEDGPQPKLGNFAWPEFAKYRAIEKQVGEPAARTLALSAAIGQYSLAFDADDTLPDGALSKICNAFDSYPSAKWVAGQESTPRHPTPWINRDNPMDFIPSGLTQPGVIYDFWKRTGQYPVTFQCSYLTEVIWRYGGYPAMPYAGDINLLFAASSTEAGVVLHDTILNYRRWDGQMTAQPTYFAVEDLSYVHAERWIKAITEGTG